jgi:hypothetical protein
MKYEFGSLQWFACLHGIICERAATVGALHPELAYSICEVFTDVPGGSSLDGASTIAWSAHITGKEVEFVLEERDDVDFKVVIAFDEVPPLARYDTMGRPERAAELAKMLEAVQARGRCRVLRLRPGSAELLGSFHDPIAKLTA